MAVANIGRNDFIWSLIATFFKVGAGVLLYPLILRMLPPDAVGVWTIFTSVNIISSILDFGFDPSFARNVSYIFSGVRSLKRTGFERLDAAVPDEDVDYSLLGDTIRAMRFFYSRMALLLFVLLGVGGTLYVHFALIPKYSGAPFEIYMSWAILCCVCSYGLYTQYYNSLLRGRGLVKRSNQIVLISNIVYLATAVMLVLLHGGLVAIVSAQASSVVVGRILSHRSFFTHDMRASLSSAAGGGDYRAVLSAITPNAVKMGLTSLGGLVINRSAIFIGSLYLPLADMASFGITLQLVYVVSALSTMVTTVMSPKVFQWRVENNLASIRRTFIASSVFLSGIYLSAGLCIGLFGGWALSLIGSQTTLITGLPLLVLILQHALESNHANAASFLMSKNEIPFFKASLVSAAATLVLLIIFVAYLRMGLIGMVFAPFLAQIAYQNWKWPLEVIRELRN